MNRDTLAGPARLATEVRKSRFLALAAPIESEADAAAFLQAVHDASASHHCWAWRLGDAYRSSDDGEPGGSAGRPILAAIDGQGYDRVVVVVLRWFGGVKLGVGGLVRAYGGAAAECLRTAPRRALVRSVEADLACDFALAGSVHALLVAVGAEKRAEGFEPEGLRLRLRLPASMVGELERRLRDLSRGAAVLTLHEADGG
jgi:putative IMPACT (imprinted ancient) family translation regulator